MKSLINKVLINTAVVFRIEKIAELACFLLGASSAVVRCYAGNTTQTTPTHDITVNWADISLQPLIELHENRDIASTIMLPDMQQQQGTAAIPKAITGSGWQAFIALPLLDNHRQPLGTLYFAGKQPLTLTAHHHRWLEDIRQVIESELYCAKQATRDHLTGLLNREAFISLIELQLLHHYHAKQPCLLVFMDLNGFKKINDDHGHAEGDRALQQFATLVNHGFRRTDIAARFGGDEFVLFLPHAKLHHGQSLLARFNSRVMQFNQQASLPFHLEFAAGIACYHGNDLPNLDKLLRDADVDMYLHKRTGRSQ